MIVVECKNCRSEVNSLAKVCPFCKQTNPTSFYTEPLIDCPHCNTKIKAGITKCPHCTGDIKYTSAVDGATGKEVRNMLLGAFIGSYLIFWGIAAYFFDNTSHLLIFILSIVMALYSTFSSKPSK